MWVSYATNLCSNPPSFIQCHLSCQHPYYQQYCNSTAPADLLEAFISQTIDSAMMQLKMLGLTSLIPATCNDLGDGVLNTTLPRYGDVSNVAQVIISCFRRTGQARDEAGAGHSRRNIGPVECVERAQRRRPAAREAGARNEGAGETVEQTGLGDGQAEARNACAAEADGRLSRDSLQHFDTAVLLLPAG